MTVKYHTKTSSATIKLSWTEIRQLRSNVITTRMIGDMIWSAMKLTEAQQPVTKGTK